MNRMNNSDVGEALIRELTFELKKISFDQYLKEFQELTLPQNVDVLQITHSRAREQALKLFYSNCTGGITAYDNSRTYSDLQVCCCAQLFEENLIFIPVL